MATIPLPVEIGKPASRALKEKGYTNLNQLALIHEEELLKLHGIGPKAIKALKSAFKQHKIDAAIL